MPLRQRKNVRFLFALLGALAAIQAWAQVPAAPSTAPPEVGTALWRGMPVHFVMRNGQPIYDGDIILDHLVFGPVPASASRETHPSRELPRTLGEVYSSTLWPSVSGVFQIPYIISNGSANLTTAINDYNA